MAKAYAHMINFYDISIIILKISGACIVIYTIISFIIKHKNKKTKIINNDNTNFENNKTLVDFVGLIILGIFLILFFIYSLKIVKVISYLAIPSTIFMIYVIYLKPIFKFKNTSFTYDYSWYGNILVIVPWIISRSDYLEFFQQINNESILQVLTIFFALIQLYLILFCIILNCYFLIKSFAELNVSKTRDNFCKLKNRLEKIFLIII